MTDNTLIPLPFSWSADFVIDNERVEILVQSDRLNASPHVSFTGSFGGSSGQIINSLREVAPRFAAHQYGDELREICEAWEALHLKSIADLTPVQVFSLGAVLSTLMLLNGERFGAASDIEDLDEADFSNADDTIDSRDVIKRIEELSGAFEAAGLDPAKLDPTASDYDAQGLSDDAEAHDYAAELKVLRALESEGENYAADWTHGETLIRHSHFKEYAQDFAEDIGAVNSDATWPNNCIDWDKASDKLKSDYTEIDFDGVAYFIR